LNDVYKKESGGSRECGGIPHWLEEGKIPLPERPIVPLSGKIHHS
jgi:hypothetical protein